jgi:hypothetical protein
MSVLLWLFSCSLVLFDFVWFCLVLFGFVWFVLWFSFDLFCGWIFLPSCSRASC